MSIREQVAKLKLDSSKMAATSLEKRNSALKSVIKALKDNKEEIIKANKLDLEKAEKDGISQNVIKRLKFDDSKLNDVIAGIEQLIKLDDPLSKLQLARELDEGLTLYRVTCPIGVIGVIFESRPDALVQISSLCIPRTGSGWKRICEISYRRR